MKITLCGSTRFKERFDEVNQGLTKAGHIVYSVAMVSSKAGKELEEDVKDTLDMVHFVKILESDAVFVIDQPTDEAPNGYIGHSTNREIKWAKLVGREVWYDSRDGLHVLCDLRGAFSL